MYGSERSRPGPGTRPPSGSSGTPLPRSSGGPISSSLPTASHRSANGTNGSSAGSTIPPFEEVRLRKDGQEVPVSISLSAIRLGGQVVAKSAIYRDISQQKQAEKAQALLAAIVDSSDDAIISITPDGMVTSWNPASERLFGWAAEEAIGRHISFIVPPDKADEFAAVMERLRQGEHFEQLETVRVCRNGIRIEVSITASPICDRDGRLTGISKIARDITDRKRTEKDLKESEERLQKQSRILHSILANMSDGVVVADERGKFVLFNPAAEQILHQGATDAPPEEWSARYSLYLPDGASPYPPAEVPLHKALRGEHADDVEMIVNHDRIPEGRWISVSARPMHDEAGILRGGIAVFRDITEKKRAEVEPRNCWPS